MKFKTWSKTPSAMTALNVTDQGNATSRLDFYLSGTGTLEQQMISLSFTADTTCNVVAAFKRWMKGERDDGSERRGVLPTDVVDVLVLGGYADGVEVREVADRLVATALFCGATTSGDNALQGDVVPESQTPGGQEGHSVGRRRVGVGASGVGVSQG